MDYKNTIDPIVAYLTDYELISNMLEDKYNDERIRNIGREIGVVGLTARDLYGQPERWDSDKEKRTQATGFFLFCQMNNFPLRINNYAFSRRVAAHCEQDHHYEILEKTREGRVYLLKEDVVETMKITNDDDDNF
jgi:hypothetical protein